LTARNPNATPIDISNPTTTKFCFKCKKSFIQNDFVIRKSTNHKTKTYHEKCWGDMQY